MRFIVSYCDKVEICAVQECLCVFRSVLSLLCKLDLQGTMAVASSAFSITRLCTAELFVSSFIMGSRTTDIRVLPPEVLRQITALLDGRDVNRLWVASDGILRRTLSRGGLQELSYHTVGSLNFDTSWPTHLLKQFPMLSTVIVSRTRGIAKHGQTRPPPASSIEILPRSLTKLDISDFYMDMSHSQRYPIAPMLAALPFSIRWLALPDIIFRDEHLDLLPSTLAYLSLTCNISDHGISKFSPNLETLKVKFYNLQHSLTLSKWPRGLHTLEIEAHESAPSLDGPELEHLPPHLTSLTLKIPMVLLVTRLSVFQHTPVIHLRFPLASIARDLDVDVVPSPLFSDSLEALALGTIDDSLLRDVVSNLPDNLKQFELYISRNFQLPHIRALPNSLTHLRLGKADNISPAFWDRLPPQLSTLIMSNHAEIQVHHLQFLPRTLTSLDTGSMTADFWHLMRSNMLPPNLKTWTSKASRRNPDFGRLLPFIDVSEQPTILRRLGYSISHMTPSSIFVFATQAIFFYSAYRQMGRILPAIPGKASAILKRGTSSWMGWLIALYWALR